MKKKLFMVLTVCLLLTGLVYIAKKPVVITENQLVEMYCKNENRTLIEYVGKEYEKSNLTDYANYYVMWTKDNETGKEYYGSTIDWLVERGAEEYLGNEFVLK